MKTAIQERYEGIASAISEAPGDAGDFIAKVRTLAIGVASDYEPARLYLVRIDNWFGPKWMRFAGKFSVASGIGFGVHKLRLHVPPFVPARVVTERVFSGPAYVEAVAAPPLHIECTSKIALQRRIAEIDNDAAFVWFSGTSEAQGRGSVMVYRTTPSDPVPKRGESLRDCAAFYAGCSRGEASWELAMLRGISRHEVEHLEESGQAAIADPSS